MNLIIEQLTKKLNEALARIEALEKENDELRARLAMNSSNSSLPPSSDRFIKKKIKVNLLERKVLNLLVDKKGIKVSLLTKLIILIILLI